MFYVNFLLLLMLSVPLSVFANDDIPLSVADDEQRLINIFKQLHQNPELSFMETETAKLVAKELKENGFDVYTGIGKTGVIGILKNGEGPVVAFRSDMDALPLKEQTNLSYKSEVIKQNHLGESKPAMHACGHDAHTTWLIGIAKQLATHKSQWSGTVVLIAQPAEELVSGALAMVNDGALKVIPKPDILISAHAFPLYPAGSVAIRSGRRMAGADSMDVVIHGVGGHGSMPHAAIDPIVMASMAVIGYQTIVTRAVDQYQPAVLTVGALQTGDTNNIIPDKALLKLNLRWYREQERQQLIQGIKRVTNNIATMYDVPDDKMPTFTLKDHTQPVINNESSVEVAKLAMIKALGKENVYQGVPPLMGSEDFHMLTADYKDVPTLWIEIGSGKPATYTDLTEKDLWPILNHNPKFLVELPAIAAGTQALTATILAFLTE